MKVMTTHQFHDEGIRKIVWSGHMDNRMVYLDEENKGVMVINKRDIIAFAKEFNLVVYEKDANL